MNKNTNTFNLNKIKSQIRNYGIGMLSGNESFIDNKDFKKIENNLKKIPKEFVLIGDAGEKNSVDVARLMTDKKAPKIVNQKHSKIVIDLLNKKYLKYFKKILVKKNLYIRRAQVNFMKKNSFVGYHYDIDSNPDYLFAVIIQLGSRFEGGEYVVYKNKRKKIIKPKYQSLIMSDCKIPHAVWKIKSGKRISFVFFLSNHFKKNRRKINAN